MVGGEYGEGIIGLMGMKTKKNTTKIKTNIKKRYKIKEKKMNFKQRFKKTGRLFVIVVVLLLFTVGTFARAPRFGRMGKDMRQGRGMMRPGISRIYHVLKVNREELKITDSQLEKIKGIMFAVEEMTVKSKNEANIQGLELKKLMMAEHKDYKRIRTALSRMSGIRHDILIAGLKAKDDVTNVLTPEQQEAVKSLMKKRMTNREFFRRDRMPGAFPMMGQDSGEANRNNDI